MHDAVSVQLPGQFAEELVAAGFRKVRLRRAVGVEPVLTLVATGAGIGADMATILLAKDAVTDFVARLRSWMSHRSKSADKFAIEVSRRSPNGELRVHLVLTLSNTDAGPDIDTRALAILLDSMIAERPEQKRRGRGAPPR